MPGELELGSDWLCSFHVTDLWILLCLGRPDGALGEGRGPRSRGSVLACVCHRLPAGAGHSVTMSATGCHCSANPLSWFGTATTAFSCATQTWPG